MEDNQAVENFKKEYERLSHQEIIPIWDEDAYCKWLEEQY